MEKCTGLITPEEKAEAQKKKEEEEAAAAATATGELDPMRSYGAWMRDIDQDTWGTVSFTFAMISGRTAIDFIVYFYELKFPF
jgi:hypothetical protein